jgi:HAD superfamily hydrolase (TIGR01509 family)
MRRTFYLEVEMIHGLIFDFDGLIIDTEWSVYQSWMELFDSFGAELPLDQWTSIIGTSEYEHFNPYDVLEQQVGRSLDRKSLRIKRYEREMELVRVQPILPGVKNYLRDAKIRGLQLGVASSSDRKWVIGNLSRLSLLDYFDIVHTSDDVERTKPDPALYRLALQSLDLLPEEAIVLEDSPNGVTAAKIAGIFTVAIPNPLTARLNLGHADLQLDALSQISLADLIEKVENHWDGKPR